MRLALFAYGSLVSPASFARTLKREPSEPIPARLPGWRRRWSVVRDNLAAEKTFERAGGGGCPPWVVGLNLERDDGGDPGRAPNGVLIEIGEGELERLDVRELRYHRVDVTAAVAEASFDRVFAYSARPEHYSADPPDGAVAMAPYLRVLEAAFTELGDGQWELFLSTTGLPPVEAIEPVLVRDEIPPGNPREW
jgi:cation transport regulator ChaC